VTEAELAVPFGVPVGEEKDGGGFLVRHAAMKRSQPGKEELGVNRIVFRPG
jgi:hypothetical protein